MISLLILILILIKAERRMPDWMANMSNLLKKVGLEKETIMMRMTGCPNGCARPYMAELALVGDGPDMYQLWAGGSPILTRISHTIANKVKYIIIIYNHYNIIINLL